MDDAGSGWHVWIGRIQMRSIDRLGEAPRLQPGGTVHCYVLAPSRDDAMMETVGEVTNDEYELLEMEWLDPVTPEGWPHEWDEEDARLSRAGRAVGAGRIWRPGRVGLRQ